MNRNVRIVVLLCAISLPSFAASCTCDDDTTNPNNTTTSVGGAGAGGAGGTTVTTGGAGGTGGTGGAGVAGAPNPWGSGPGKVGSVSEIGKKLPFVQGMASQTMMFPRDSSNKCANSGGAGGTAGAGGTGGAPGTAGTGGVAGASTGGAGGSGGAPDPDCPSTYTPKVPVFDLSGIPSTTSIQIALVVPPVFQPVVVDHECPTSGQLISNAKVFIGDCTGELKEIPVFEDADLGNFFGLNGSLPLNSRVTLEGQPVQVVTGLALKQAVCGSRLFEVSNGSGIIIVIDLLADAGSSRTVYDSGYTGLSGLLCQEDGSVLFTTSRTFTVGSWNSAGTVSDPSALEEVDPIHLISLDPTSGTLTIVSDISGGSRILTQGCVPTEYDIDGNPINVFLAGNANILARAVDGDILFADHLAGTVWKISPDGLTQTEVFTSPDLITGMWQAPNGQIYTAKSPKTDMGCGLITKPTIATYNEVSGQLDDWMTLESPEYDSVLPQLCVSTGVIERDFLNGIMFLGVGNFNDLTGDAEGNLFVTESVRNVTTAIHVVFDEPDGGVGGSGGTGGSGGGLADAGTD